jgi:hypothetical protein
LFFFSPCICEPSNFIIKFRFSVLCIVQI